MLATSETYVVNGVPLPSPRACRVVQVMVATRDHDESVRFYTEAFGLEFDADFSSFVLLVDDVDARHSRALGQGATEISPPTDCGWKPRCSVVDDPSGNRIQLSQG